MASFLKLFSPKQAAIPEAQIVAPCNNEVDLDAFSLDPLSPRQTYDQEVLDRMAASIKARGVLLPVKARKDEQGKLVLLSGDLRWLAARQAGLTTIPAVIVEGSLTPGDALEERLVENCLRCDLHPIDQARGFMELMSLRAWTATELADRVHLNRSTVSRALALLRQPLEVQSLVATGRLPASTAGELKGLPAEEQIALAQQAANEGLSRAEVREEARYNTVESITMDENDIHTGEPENDAEMEPEDSVGEYTSGDAQITVRFPRPFARAEEFVQALEDALCQAQATLQPLRATA